MENFILVIAEGILFFLLGRLWEREYSGRRDCKAKFHEEEGCGRIQDEPRDAGQNEPLSREEYENYLYESYDGGRMPPYEEYLRRRRDYE